MTICKFKGCTRIHYAKGYCQPHWGQHSRGSELKPIGWKPPKRYCSLDGCSDLVKARNMCDKHYRKSLRDAVTQECKVSGCKYLIARRGYCSSHYRQALEWGESKVRPLGGSSLTRGMTDEARFDFYVHKTDTCWVWIGARRGGTGYGSFYSQGEGTLAHRYSYQRFVGPIPDGFVIDHKCHNRACVNPDHLQVVTHKQNMENHSGADSTSKTGVRGVFFDPRNDAFAVQVKSDGKSYWGGRHSSLKAANEAAIALRNAVHTNNLTDRKANK